MSQPIIQTPAGDACPLPSKATDTKATAAPKPCCVCKEEKARRDECMLFSNQGEEDCKPTIDLYRACMAGYGFRLP